MNEGRLSFTEWLNAMFEIPYTLRTIMANQNELRQQVIDLQTKLDAEQEQVRQRDEARLAAIQQLRDQIEQLNQQIQQLRENPEIAADITDGLQRLSDDIGSTVEDVAEPTPEEES